MEFSKTDRTVPPDFYQAEAAGLAWLRVSGGPRIVRVFRWTQRSISLERVDQVQPTPAAVRAFGCRLAQLHQVQAKDYGGPPPGVGPHGYIGTLPMDYGAFRTFGQMYAELKILPYLRVATQHQLLPQHLAKSIDEIATRLATNELAVGPAIAARRLHGDLWNGNVLWVRAAQGVEAVLIDPACYAGHPETDIAMLHLFGLPYLEEFLATYESSLPLSPGWRERIALHQLYPLLVHVVLFPGSYVAQLEHAAGVVLRELC